MLRLTLWFRLMFSVLIFWNKVILEQNSRIHPQIPFPFLRRGRQLACLSCSTDLLSLLTTWKNSSLEDEAEETHPFVAGSSSWSREATSLLISCSLQVLQRDHMAFQVKELDHSLLTLGDLSSLYFNIAEPSFQEADRGHLGTLSPKLNTLLELTCVPKSSILSPRLTWARPRVCLGLLFLIAAFFSLPRQWEKEFIKAN